MSEYSLIYGGGMSTPSGRAKPLPPEERREALIAATLPLLRQYGRDVSTRQIAQAACVAEGTIFRVFEDKASLIDAAIRSALDPARAIEALEAVDRTLPLEERLVAVAEVLKSRLSDVFFVLDAMGHKGPPTREALRKASWRPTQERNADAALIAGVIDVIGADADSLRVKAEVAARVLNWLVFTNSHPLLGRGADFGPEAIVSIVLDGVRRPASSKTKPASGKEK